MIARFFRWLTGTKPETKREDDMSVEFKIEDFRTQLQKDYDTCQQIKKKVSNK